jgi:hypothetical protein
MSAATFDACKLLINNKKRNRNRKFWKTVKKK